MPETPVNLNKFRKARRRVDDERRAAENRARFGRTKEARAKDEAERERTKKTIDGKRLD